MQAILSIQIPSNFPNTVLLIIVTLLFYKQLSSRNSPFCLVLPHSLVLQGSSLEMPRTNLEVISLILCLHESVKEWHVKETKALGQQFEAHMLCYAETTCLQVLGNLLHFLHSHQLQNMKTNERDPLVSSLYMIPYVPHCSVTTMAK